MDGKFNSKPFIRLSGSWLSEIGFEVGKQFKVEAADNKLILELIKEENE